MNNISSGVWTYQKEKRLRKKGESRGETAGRGRAGQARGRRGAGGHLPTPSVHSDWLFRMEEATVIASESLKATSHPVHDTNKQHMTLGPGTLTVAGTTRAYILTAQLQTSFPQRMSKWWSIKFFWKSFKSASACTPRRCAAWMPYPGFSVFIHITDFFLIFSNKEIMFVIWRQAKVVIISKDKSECIFTSLIRWVHSDSCS